MASLKKSAETRQSNISAPPVCRALDWFASGLVHLPAGAAEISAILSHRKGHRRAGFEFLKPRKSGVEADSAPSGTMKINSSRLNGFLFFFSKR